MTTRLRVAAAVALAIGVASCGEGQRTIGERRADQVRDAAAAAGLADEVQDFAARLASAVDATYQVIYSTDGPGDEARQVLVAQRPPDRRIDVVAPDGATERSIIGTDSVQVCSRPADGDWTCTEAEPDAAPPTVGVFDETAIDDLVDALRRAVSDYDFDVFARPVAGIEARCLVTRLKEGRPPSAELGQLGTLCISDEGVVLLAAEPGRQLEATSYTTDISEDSFERPD